MAGTAGPTSRELAVEIRNVIQDLPVLLTAPLYRRWHLRWGSTPAEVASRLPGDGLMPGAQYKSTRAINIDAPPEAVWPWLVQVGCLRAGWYSNDLLDNLTHPSATVIVPELQHIEVGQWVPMSPKPSARSSLKVHSFEANRWLLWTTPDSTWAWQLTPTDRGTRLIARITHATTGGTRTGRTSGDPADGVRRLRDAAQNAPRHQGPSRGPGTRPHPARWDAGRGGTTGAR